MNNKILIGSRGSELALWQANFVFNELSKQGVESEIIVIKTQGDKIQNLSLDKLEGKGFFTKEIEDSLLAKETDLAVHSHKDLPTVSPEGLSIGAVSYREDPSELLLINKDALDNKLKLGFKKNAVIGTSSARRKSQLLALRNDIEIKDIRGNVPTRIQKLRNKDFDAIMLAAAGVFRLGLDLSDFIVVKLDPKEFVPAPAQGVLALQMRDGDNFVGQVLSRLNHQDVADTIAIERKILNLFDGGCHLPLGAYCIKEDNVFKVWVSKANSWDTLPVRIFMQSETHKGFAEKVVEKINGLRPSSVFISRDSEDCTYFSDSLKANGCSVFSESLIKVNRIGIDKFESCNWVFFSSKNAVKHFFDQNPILQAGAKFAAIGKGTAKAVISYGKELGFVGNGNDTKNIASKFNSKLNGESVLFPMANKGLRTIQKELSDKNKSIDLPVYEVLERQEINIPETDIVVLTSPSNARAYFKNRKVKPSQKLIAIGKSTLEEIHNLGFPNPVLSNSFDETGLLESVFGC